MLEIAENNPQIRKYADKIWQSKRFFMGTDVFVWYAIPHKRMSLNLFRLCPCWNLYYRHTQLRLQSKPAIFQNSLHKDFPMVSQATISLCMAISSIIFNCFQIFQSMVDIYVNLDKIVVIGNAWEHFNKIKDDETLKSCKLELFMKPYFFSLGGLIPNKNIQWILKVSQHHL